MKEERERGRGGTRGELGRRVLSQRPAYMLILSPTFRNVIAEWLRACNGCMLFVTT